MAIRRTLKNLGLSAAAGTILMLPFFLMELINRQGYRASGKEPFPYFLFSNLWIVAIGFFLLLLPLARAALAGKNLLARPFLLIIQLALMGLLAWGWSSLIIDQWRCFIGVPLCD